MGTKRLTILAVLFSLAALSAAAADTAKIAGFAAGAKVAMISSDNVRLRSGPSTTAAIVGSLNVGDLAIVEGQSAQPQKIGDGSYYWMHLKLPDGTEGWAYGLFVYQAIDWSLPAKVGSRTYTAAQFQKPEGAEARGFSSNIVPALVDAESHRALPVKMHPPYLVSVTDEGWMLFYGDEATEVTIESITSTGADSMQLVVVKRAWDGTWKVTSRARVSCQLREGGKTPYFEMVAAEDIPLS